MASQLSPFVEGTRSLINIFQKCDKDARNKIVEVKVGGMSGDCPSFCAASSPYSMRPSFASVFPFLYV